MLPAGARDILKQYWGYDQFRNRQEEIIAACLDGRDVLAILATGGGKSICYQLPALMLPGITLVVSPLIALMRDQVSHLRRRGIAAEALHSALSLPSSERILDNLRLGKVKLLYVSPERLQSSNFQALIGQLELSLIAIDEAHCISQWGYDFRPSYLLIQSFLQAHSQLPVLALTATATLEVEADIVRQLGLRKPALIKSSAARSNLSYQVRTVASKSDQIVRLLKENPGPTIIYLRSRRKTQDLAQYLQKLGIPATFYHAGLDAAEREKRQDGWIRDQSRVMVATNAFGMGIDKPNVRLVIHVDIPDSLEAYFQEAGRAGRDGAPALAVLLFNPASWEEYEARKRQAFPQLAFVRQVYLALSSYYQLAIGAGAMESLPFHFEEFCTRYQLPLYPSLHALQLLAQAGWFEMIDFTHLPATVQVLVRADELYSIQLQHRELDPLIQALLRVYPGLFDYPVEISENKISELLRGSPEAVKKGLQALHRMGVVDYKAREEGSRMLMLRERAATSEVQIDQELFRFRKERMEQQLSWMQGYLLGNECRSQYVLRYFGETDAPPCGLCDICLREAKSPSLRNLDQFWEHLKQWTAGAPLEIESLRQLATDLPEADLLYYLQTLQSEAKIRVENKRITRLAKH